MVITAIAAIVFLAHVAVWLSVPSGNAEASADEMVYETA